MPVSCGTSIIVCKTCRLPAVAGLAVGNPPYGRQARKARHFTHCSMSCTPAGAGFPGSPVDGGARSGSGSLSGGLHALRLGMQSRGCFPDRLSTFSEECPAEVAIEQESIKKRTWNRMRRMKVKNVQEGMGTTEN